MTPSHAIPHAILSIHAQISAGRLVEAEAACRRILSSQPDQVETLVNFAIVLLRTEQIDEALATANRAVALRPEAAEAHNALGSIHARQGRFDEALGWYEQAIRLRPDRASFHNNRGSVLQHIGRLDDSIAAFDGALARQPDLATAQANRLFALHFHPDYLPEQIADELRHWGERVETALPLPPVPHVNDPSRDRRLRIGYVSPHLRDHCLGRLMWPILRQHDGQAMELFIYSDALRADLVTDQFRSIASAWRDTAALSDDALARTIRADRIDILIDLTLHMSGSRLLTFGRKPAPIQVTYGGYPGATGLRAIDYRLTDPYLDPPGKSDAPALEEPVRLPDCFWCYAPCGPQPEPAEPPSERAGFITFGCLNNFAKVNPRLLALWARVLKTIEHSRLLLLAPAGSARTRTFGLLESHGISSDRIEFVAHQPLQDYLRTYARIDIVLDTFPYNGHTTSLDALWMGVPLVTLVGHGPVGRAGLSILENLDLGECAADDENQFVAVATRLAHDRGLLRRARADLRPLMLQSPLTDPTCFARNLEAAYRGMWHRWCENRGHKTRSPE